MFTFACGNFGQKSAKEYTENSQVQKGYEFFYLGSKTTSSTTVLPSSPKKAKNESDPLNNSTANNTHLFPANILIAEETEYCVSPNPNNNSDSNENIISNLNLKNELKSSNGNKEQNLNTTTTNDINILNPNINTNNNSCNSNAIKFVTRENFSKKYHTLIQNSNANTAGINNTIINNTNNNYNFSDNGNQASLLGNSGSSGQTPHFNYGKFQEAVKLNQLGSANSNDSASNNLINASTSDSPLSFNKNVVLDIKSNCYNNLNLIFTDDYFPRNSFKSNCKFYCYINILLDNKKNFFCLSVIEI